MPDEHKSLIYGDSFQVEKCNRCMMRKQPSWQPKDKILPMQSRIEKQKSFLERVSKEIETKQQKRLEILQTWIEADQELEAANSKQTQAKHEMVTWVAE